MSIEDGITIMPFMAGRVHRTTFLESSSISIVFWVSLADPNCDGLILAMKSDGYLLATGIKDGRLYLERNGYSVSLPLEPSIETDVSVCSLKSPCHIGIVWSPTELTIYVNAVPETVATPPQLPPNSLLEWARRHAIIPVTTYDDKRAFADAVLNGLSGISDKIAASRMESAFWDFNYSGPKIISRAPKKETQVHGTVHGLLWDLAIAKNFQIFPEAMAGSGRLDFLITAPLTNGVIAKACIEFKNAHSPDVLHGLLSQLPEYMRIHGTNIGFYCVPWFCGKHFNQPGENLSEFRGRLVEAKYHAGLSDLSLVILDVSGGTPPSQNT